MTEKTSSRKKNSASGANAIKARGSRGRPKASGKKLRRLPVMPLRNIVVFPHMIVPLFVGREKSIQALAQLNGEVREIILASQKDMSLDVPGIKDIYPCGTLAKVLQIMKLPDGTLKVLVEGARRVRLELLEDRGSHFEATAASTEEKDGGTREELDSLAVALLKKFEEYVGYDKKVPDETLASLKEVEDLSRLSDTIVVHLRLRVDEKQQILETLDLRERLERVYTHLLGEIDLIRVDARIQGRVRQQMERTQREYYLNEQIKAIQKELEEGDGVKDEISELEERLQALSLTEEAREKAASEIKKLRAMPPMSAESGVVRNYLEWIASLPWGRKSALSRSLDKAQKILDVRHYGLEKIKDQILEYLAVQSRTKKLSGPILCLAGPPGVGKTSLARSIAEATGRKFVRMSLGGVRDESEVRGHRRTYIGALPGKILQGMKKAGSSNPLFLLDEIDKLGSDWRGDPSSALLEVLDPEQNREFSDHYLELGFDLSNVMFVTTANSLDMPPALMDRMEIIHLAGYSQEEKLEIARSHLLPRQISNHKFRKGEWEISEKALAALISDYTREAGVRSLDRMLARLARKAMREILENKSRSVKVSAADLEKYLGPPKFQRRYIDGEDQVGIVTGLAWTSVGGEILTIETLLVPGKGQIRQTGKLGEVMRESVSAAWSYVRSRAGDWGIRPSLFENRDAHVHLPEGAVPKDGPSAGSALALALVSLLTDIPVHRDIGMTGEVTLRGRILEIGGLKEKLLAAARAGVRRVLIPRANARELSELPQDLLKQLEIIPVGHMDEVIRHGLVKTPRPLPEEFENAAILPPPSVGVASLPLSH